LPKTLKEIFEKRIMAEEPVTLQEIGDKYKVSRERIRQIQERLIKKIKEYLRTQIPNFEEDYLDLVG